MSNSSEVDGGGKRRIDLGEDDAEIDELFDYGNNYEKDDDSTVDNNASYFMERISKDVTATHQVTLMFQFVSQRLVHLWITFLFLFFLTSSSSILSAASSAIKNLKESLSINRKMSSSIGQAESLDNAFPILILTADS